MGIEENISKVYLVNMKLASKYIKISGRCHKHIPYEENIVSYCKVSLFLKNIEMSFDSGGYDKIIVFNNFRDFPAHFALHLLTDIWVQLHPDGMI